MEDRALQKAKREQQTTDQFLVPEKLVSHPFPKAETAWGTAMEQTLQALLERK